MKFFSSILGIFRFFTVYADSFEEEVDHFLRNVKKRSSEDLRNLVQRDLVKLTVFLEYKFKGYKKLKKRHRFFLYGRSEFIAKDLIRFLDLHHDEILGKWKREKILLAKGADERMVYLFGIMQYLKPGIRLQYKESVTFEKLLRDPLSEKLVGDCNQITTLYIYLYSLKFPVSDLQIKILPQHICLHYKGIDIETTNATFTRYSDYTFIGNVEEIVAANLLDIPDPSEKAFEVSPANLMKSAELAFQFSSHRQTVEKNLFIAYHNMAVYHAKNNDFSKAMFFANKSGKTKLQKEVMRMEAIYHLKAKRYKRALEKFRKAGDRPGEKACYQNELSDLADKMKCLKTLHDYKGHRTELRRMKELAILLENQIVLKFVNDIQKKI